MVSSSHGDQKAGWIVGMKLFSQNQAAACYQLEEIFMDTVSESNSELLHCYLCVNGKLSLDILQLVTMDQYW